MRRQPRRDTGPEIALRRELWRRGLRYRIDEAPLPNRRRRADLVFRGPRVAVFVDGCFWHRCPAHGTLPRANRAWWEEKLTANVRRDRDTDAALNAAGWLGIRIWEHQDPVLAADRVEAAVRDRSRS